MSYDTTINETINGLLTTKVLYVDDNESWSLGMQIVGH